MRNVMRLGFAAAALVACSFIGSTTLQGADEEKPKTIKEVMKLVFKKNALKDKAIAGEADAATRVPSPRVSGVAPYAAPLPRQKASAITPIVFMPES